MSILRQLFFFSFFLPFLVHVISQQVRVLSLSLYVKYDDLLCLFSWAVIWPTVLRDMFGIAADAMWQPT